MKKVKTKLIRKSSRYRLSVVTGENLVCDVCGKKSDLLLLNEVRYGGFTDELNDEFAHSYQCPTCQRKMLKVFAVSDMLEQIFRS